MNGWDKSRIVDFVGLLKEPTFGFADSLCCFLSFILLPVTPFAMLFLLMALHLVCFSSSRYLG
jgi:hypothetical protein